MAISEGVEVFVVSCIWGEKEDQSTTPSEIWPGRPCPQMTWCRVTFQPAKQALTRQDAQVAQCWLPHHGDEQQDKVGRGT